MKGEIFFRAAVIAFAGLRFLPVRCEASARAFRVMDFNGITVLYSEWAGAGMCARI